MGGSIDDPALINLRGFLSNDALHQGLDSIRTQLLCGSAESGALVDWAREHGIGRPALQWTVAIGEQTSVAKL